MSDLIQQVERSILTRQLIQPGQTVLVAVSGGVDSMVLLHVLESLSRVHRWKLVIAHFNHHLRGNSSAADERFVARVAKEAGLRCILGAGDVRGHAKKNKVSIEMAARQLRHEFLASTAQRLKVRTVALAHHADDQTELFLLRLLRGSGDEGLSGMNWRNNSPADSSIELIRPLLEQSKETLQQSAGMYKLKFRADATNHSHEFLRNRIRHELLPLLKRNYQPGLDRVVRRVISITEQNADYINLAAQGWLDGQSEIKSFEALHIAVQRRCIQLQLWQLGFNPDFDLIERLRKVPDTGVSAGTGRFLFNRSGRLRVCDSLLEAGETFLAAAPPKRHEITGNSGRILWRKREILWRISSQSGPIPKGTPGKEIFDADRVGAVILLRYWQPGDRFQPIGMDHPVKLQDLFTNARIPRTERHRLLVAATAEGNIFWVEKLRISEQFKVTSRTNRRLLWHWKLR